MAIINMQTMRYINLLDKASSVKTEKCFVYNNTIFFAVHKELVSKAIGSAGINVRMIQEHLGKKIKIIAEPIGPGDASRFVLDVVSPTRFKSIEIKDRAFVITAGTNQNKAALIGRNRRRFFELEIILKDIFGLGLKII